MVDRLAVSANVSAFDNEADMVGNLTAVAAANGSKCFAPGAGRSNSQ